MLKITAFVQQLCVYPAPTTYPKGQCRRGSRDALCMGTAPNVNSQPTVSCLVTTASYVITDVDPSLETWIAAVTSEDCPGDKTRPHT